ncbi:MAG TPA: BACON domain-containing carbohydrate-binding protein [Vicinamibacterales bacterium]|nr:BACON domain-containing carbohydrate-binding protein [Vicinamibacterales bacterium]
MAALALLASGCGRATEISSTSPSAPKCQVSVDSSLTTAPAAGGTGSLGISTTRDCTWDASSEVNWIALTSASSGQGSGTVSYRVDANGVPTARKGTLEVNGSQVTVSQEAAPCLFAVSPLNPSVSAPGGSVTVNVSTLAGCAWTAASQAPWIHVTGGATGSAPGSVALAIDANSGAARSGVVTVAGQAVTISQAEAPAPAPTPTPLTCTFSINPLSDSESPAAGSGSIGVTASDPTCVWTAISNVTWLTIAAGASGTGSGRVAYTVAANTDAARTGTMTVAGKTFTVNQAAAGCSYLLSPASQSVDSGGGSGSFTVASGAWCSWNAAAGMTWISITGGASGSGNGTVSFSVAANSGAARSGTISVGGQTFTISQAALPPPPCTFSISPTNQTVDPAGGAGTVTVTASSPSCTWTAASNNGDWLTVTSGSSGTGSGTAGFGAAVNSGPARTGTLTIAGQTFTVSQGAAPPPCTFSISPASQDVPPGGGGGTVTVTASAANCSWTAASNTPWLTITNGASGTGSGTVTFNAAANGDGMPRSATLTVAGQTFTVNEPSSQQP